ncbi:hypothetical protein BT69DRAFT_1218457, partial [Atractiella rhizophila]
PVEVLHTVLLGIVKYVWACTIFKITPTFKERLRVQLEAACTATLDSGSSINAEYLIQYGGSLVGKELKILMQVMTWATRPMVDDRLMSKELWEVWRVLGAFASRLWVPAIPEVSREEYLVSVRNSPAILDGPKSQKPCFLDKQLQIGQTWSLGFST